MNIISDMLAKKLRSFSNKSLNGNEISDEEIMESNILAKKEEELNNNDRLYLLNKTLDQNFIENMYETFFHQNNNFSEELLHFNKVDLNDYVYTDIEFLHDNYFNTKNSIISKLNKCQTIIGKKILENISESAVHTFCPIHC